MTRVVVEELDLNEYRGVRRLAKPLKLRGLNVLIGRNGVGKTAILEALYLLSRPYTAYQDPVYDRSVLKYIAEMHGGVASLVYGYAGTAELVYKLKGLTDDIHVKVTSDGNVIVVSGGYNISDSGYETLLKRFNAGFKVKPLSFMVPDDSNAYRLMHKFLLKQSVWAWIEKRGLHVKVVDDLLAGIIADTYTEVTVRYNRLHVRKEREKGKGPLYVDLDSLGEGIKRVLTVYLTVEYLDPRILLWDDIEVAAHPSLLDKLLAWLERMERQVVVTTHSIDVLYYLALHHPRDAQVVLLTKTGDDVLDYRVIEIDELEEMFEKGIDARAIERLGL